MLQFRALVRQPVSAARPGLWGYSAISAPTLGGALSNLVDLFHFHQQSSSMSLRRHPDGLMRLEYQIEAPGLVERRRMRNCRSACSSTSSATASASSRCRKRCRSSIRVRGQPRARKAFGAPVYFSLTRNALLFRPEIMSEPMPHCETQLMAMMQMCLRQLESEPQKCASFTDRLKAVVRASLPDGYPAFDGVPIARVAPTAIGASWRAKG